nr:thiamine phosphate synthase [uncultured Porphyromonas sp.]
MRRDQVIVLTPPEWRGTSEASWIATLLRLGVGRVHIRKPEASAAELSALLEAIPRALRRRCVLSQQPELVRRYALGGLHLSVRGWRELAARPSLASGQLVGVSCHSREELEALPFAPDYAYLSPVAPSLSKEGYGAAQQHWTEAELGQLCAETPFPLIALGGIAPATAGRFLRLGFAAVASLGYWQGLSLEELPEALRRLSAPRLVLCGGLDPTGGAGITADLSHAQRLGAESYSLITAVTSQDTEHFYGLTPLGEEELRGQLRSLEALPPPEVAKIGLVASLEQLQTLTRLIHAQYPHCLILWDPILRSSSGYQLLPTPTAEELEAALREVDLLLPNAYEQHQLLGELSPAEAARRWHCTLICKGARPSPDLVPSLGAGQDTKAGEDTPTGPCADLDPSAAYITDLGYTPEGRCIESYCPPAGTDRHGTGCLYGTELALALASGLGLETAMRRAQRAVSHYRAGLEPPAARPRPTLGRRMFVTHGSTPEKLLLQTERVLSLGLADLVELRMKEASAPLREAAARQLLGLCRSYGVPLLINDDVELAFRIAADGVHLGQQDCPPERARQLLGPEALIGLTCNDAQQLERALQLPIDYIGLGPCHYTETKQRLAPILGHEGYRRLQLHDYPLPVYAIGGIEPQEEPELRALGLYGIAMSRSLLRSTGEGKTPLPHTPTRP